MKKIINTHLAIITSIFTFFAVVYTLIIKDPLYIMNSFYKLAIFMVAIHSLAIHNNALKESEEKKLILISLAVPVVVIIYIIIGLIYWANRGY